MSYHIWPSENIPGIGVSQVPLILAWALTIHKSQGCTLDAAEMDIGSTIFEYGQTYVALSRVKELNGLYLSSFDHKKIKVNKKVKDYYRGLLLKTEEKKGCENKSEEKRELYDSSYY
jgi:ATP-dependent DNA helicase PIF1